MMKNTIISPYRKFRLLLILPVLAGLLYAFAKPVYRLPAGYENVTVQPQDKVAKGVVVNQKGEPLSGAAVIAQGTTIGTVTDAKGNFALGKFPPESALVITYVGYTGKVVKPNYNELMKIIMVRDTINAMGLTSAPPPPPPPPPTDPFGSGKPPLVIIDGKVSNVKISDIPVETIESINVVKGETAVKKYGDKAKEGVIEITTKAPGETKVSSEKVYMMSEEMPSFPGGHDEMLKWMMVNFKYPEEAKKKGIQGQVIVSFEVAATGKLANVKAERSVHPLLDGEAVRLVSSMPDWTPGKQNGKPVSIIMKLPVVFKLN